MKRSRVDIIGQNGNEGEHYEEVDKMSGGMDKDESCFGCVYCTYSYDEYPCSRCNRAFSGMQRDYYRKENEDVVIDKKPKNDEKEYLTKLIDDHWAYIEKLLEAHDTDKDIIEVAKFHYKSAGFHFWKHCREWMEGKG